MVIKEIKPYSNSQKGLKVTPLLFALTLQEVMDRLTGKKKGGPFDESLEQILLNKMTGIKLREELGMKEGGLDSRFHGSDNGEKGAY